MFVVNLNFPTVSSFSSQRAHGIWIEWHHLSTRVSYPHGTGPTVPVIYGRSFPSRFQNPLKLGLSRPRGHFHGSVEMMGFICKRGLKSVWDHGNHGMWTKTNASIMLRSWHANMFVKVRLDDLFMNVTWFMGFFLNEIVLLLKRKFESLSI